MASKTLIIILALALIAVTIAASFELELEDEDLALEDFQEYFQAQQMEKRGAKVGPCKKPDGKPCALCNLKVRNKSDMRRYIACGSAGGGRKI